MAMKNLTRRDLFRGARTAAVGVAAAVVLPKMPEAPLEPVFARLPPSVVGGFTEFEVSASVSLVPSRYLGRQDWWIEHLDQRALKALK